MGKQKNKANSQPAMFAQENTDDQIEWQAIREARKAHHVNGITIILIISVIMSMLSIMISLRSSGNVQTLVDNIQTILDTKHDDNPGRGVALSNVNSWLAGDSTPVPNGFSNLSWVSCSKVQDTSKGELWSHKFDFTDKRTGLTRTVAQLVLVGKNTSTAVGTPTIFPFAATGNSSSSDTTTPTGYKDMDGQDAVKNVVEQWAKAYVGSDSTSLTVLVGDPKTSHAYQSAGLGTYKNSSVNWAVWCTQDGKVASSGSGYAAVSVSIMFTPKYDAPDPTSTNSEQSEQDQISDATTRITVLVAKPTSGAAKVVDWEPDGALRSLRPYSQAVSSGSVSDDDDDSSTGSSDGASDDSSDSASGGNSQSNSADSTDSADME